jgi:hypothetical protein
MRSLFDVPAHVFFVHAPVVLTPLMTLACLAIVSRPAWRRRYGWHLVVGCAVVAIATLLAVQSGEEFAEALEGAVPIGKHQDLAETTRLFVLGQLVLAVGLVLAAKRFEANAALPGTKGAIEDRPVSNSTSTVMAHDRTVAGQPAVLLILSGALVVCSVLATVWMVRTGHEGAQVTWSGTLG